MSNEITIKQDDFQEVNPKAVKKKREPFTMEVAFVQKPSEVVEAFREYKEQVITANIREHIPQHMQSDLLNQFAKEGYIQG